MYTDYGDTHMLLCINGNKKKQTYNLHTTRNVRSLYHTKSRKDKTFLGNLLFAEKGFQAVDVFHALCHKEMYDIRSYGLKQPIAIIPNGINLPNKKNSYTRTDTYKHLLYLGRLHKKKE